MTSLCPVMSTENKQPSQGISYEWDNWTDYHVVAILRPEGKEWSVANVKQIEAYYPLEEGKKWVRFRGKWRISDGVSMEPLIRGYVLYNPQKKKQA